MYLKHNNTNRYYLDIEADGLKPTKIWCVVIKHSVTQQVWKFINDGSASIYHELNKFFDEHNKADSVWIGHNIVSFDAPVLGRLAGVSLPISRLVDTLVLSYLYNPGLEGGHSLEAYGDRLRFPKVAHEDWSQYTPEMLHRCEMDVELTQKVYEALQAKMLKIGYSELSCKIEHYIREIIDRQTTRGFYLHKDKTVELRDFLRNKEKALSEPILKLFPKRLVEVKTYDYKLRKDGSPYSHYYRHKELYPEIKVHDNGTYTVYDWEEFNIASPPQRLSRLLEYGYDPVEKTKTGKPKVDEESLLAFAKESNLPEVQMIAEWLVANGRANMLDTWLNYLGEDSRIHGTILTCAASTRRMIHNRPNTANIPSGAKAAYGAECRSLWSCEPLRGLKLVGVDASGLETVGLLHYLNNKEAEAILSRPKPHDVHTLNSIALTQLLGWPVDREWGAKTSWYAWLYGAYPPKIGSIVKGTPADGQKVIDTFFKNVPGLKHLIEDVQWEWKTNHGFLRTIDGGYVRCSSLNAALNYRIQSLGAIVMKLAAIILDTKREFEWWAVGNIHDEFQMETAEKNAEELGRIAVESIGQAAEELNFKTKLTGDFKLGDTWNDTH